MCETCGVSAEQDAAARRVVHFRCVAQWYRGQGIDPAYFEIEEYTDRRVRTAAALAERYRRAHPGRAMTREQMAEWCAQREAERERTRALASQRGC